MYLSTSSRAVGLVAVMSARPDGAQVSGRVDLKNALKIQRVHLSSREKFLLHDVNQTKKRLNFPAQVAIITKAVEKKDKKKALEAISTGREALLRYQRAIALRRTTEYLVSRYSSFSFGCISSGCTGGNAYTPLGVRKTSQIDANSTPTS